MNYWAGPDVVHTLEKFRAMPLAKRCSELARYFQVAPPKELMALFPLLMVDMFGNPLEPTSRGWQLLTCSSQETFGGFTSLPDAEALVAFLSPEGPLLGLIYRLLDPAFKYDFPVAALPEWTRRALETGGHVTSFLVSKLCSYNHSLQLNAFEFYIFRFAQYLTKELRQPELGTLNVVPQDRPSQSETLYSIVLQRYLNHFLPLGESTGLPPIPSDSLRGNSPGLLSPHSQDTWRSETLLLALLEFWLANSEVSNPELIMMVRILIKHLHYFANSGGGRTYTALHPSTAVSSPLSSLRCMVIPQVLQKRLYSFLTHVFHHWPLDTSFRMPVEAWLSYIQPWRYIQPRQSGTSSDLPVDSHWSKFVGENLQFYTALLVQILPRFFRMELHSYKNVFCLFRIARVMSQDNLVDLILEAESKPPIFGDPDYVPLHSDSMRTMVFRLIQRMCQARSELAASFSVEAPSNQSMLDWLQGMLSFSEDQAASEQASLTDDYLKLTIDFLAKIFKLDVKDLMESRQVPRSADTSVEDLMNPVTNTLTPLGRCQVLNQSFQPPIQVRGNPDLYHICSFEISCLVRFLHRLSSELNERFGERFQARYQRQDPIGWVCRQLLAAPTVYYEGTTRVALPARLRLRILGHRSTVLGTVLVLLLAYLGDSLGMVCLGGVVLLGLLALVLVGRPH